MGRLATQTTLQRTHKELNDTVFTQYHRFGAEMKIVTVGTSQTDGNSP
jgi:hypothetical protein